MTAEDIDKWFPGSSGESQESGRQRCCRYRNEAKVSVPFSSATFHPGGCHRVVWILWLLPEEELRDRGKDMAASNKARDLLPTHVSRQEKSLFMEKHSDFLGGVVPTSVLLRIHRELTGNCSAPSHRQEKELEKRVLQCIVSNGDPSWWPDLRAATNGNNGTRFEVFWKYSERVMEQIGGAVANRQDDVRRLTAQTGPISIPDLHKRIDEHITENGTEAERNAPRPSLNLLSILPMSPSQLKRGCKVLHWSIQLETCRRKCYHAKIQSRFVSQPQNESVRQCSGTRSQRSCLQPPRH